MAHSSSVSVSRKSVPDDLQVQVVETDNRRAAKPAKSGKPSKPHPDFPLSPRTDGRWAKKVGGKVFIFAGTPEEAIAEWNRSKDFIFQHGRKPPEGSGQGLTLEDICDHYLNAKKPLVASGELTSRKYAEYFATCERMLSAWGKGMLVASLRPDDFDKFRASAASKWGLHRVAGEVQTVRSVFKFAFENNHIDRPVRFGQNFKKPSKTSFRRARAAAGPKLIEAAEIRKLLTKAGVQLKAMVMLGINCGFGNADCGQLPFRALDLDNGWVRLARGKTGIDRRCPLWPETVAALKAAIAKRPVPKLKEHEQLVFITKRKLSWFKETPDNPISWEFRKLLNELELHTTGKGFYWLRHTFETISGGAKDQVATDLIMGHVDESMAETYRQRIDDARLVAVSNHVHAWLFPPKKKAAKVAKKGGAK